jgi:hypothetical protein
MTQLNLLDSARYAWICFVSSDTQHQYWGRCIHKFLKCLNKVMYNSKASYRVSWMSDSSLKIYYGTEVGRNIFAALFPCNLRQGRFWASGGSHGGGVKEPVHLAYNSVSLRLSFGSLGRWRWHHSVSSKRRRLRSDAFTYRGRVTKEGFCLLERRHNLAVIISPF